jgi:uncharacterized hydrophobic protein (TIGR00271 family)
MSFSSKRALLHAIDAAQDRLLDVFGSSPERRADIVEEALRREVHEVAGYWLKLVVAVGIASLGLVVGSTAVIIGAMLVAPLMGPIVDLALGLGAGSPVLVIRSALRVLGSIAVATAGSAAMTRALPFHIATSEIAARTAPTALDLGIAAFCAFAGVFASLRPKTDTVSTAAGTSIGISLVPPLCTVGFGIGVGDRAIATGAAMLFLANFAAIVVVGTLAYLATGFDRVDAGPMEEAELARRLDSPIVRRLAGRLSRFFASPFGHPARLLMPVAFLATVYVPLRRALDEVAWQVRARHALEAGIAQAPGPILERRLRVESHAVDAFLVLAGSPADARRFEATLVAEVERASGAMPRIEVLAVPEAGAFEALAARLARPEAPAPMPASALASELRRRELLEAIRKIWPSDVLGDPLRVHVGLEEPATIRIDYLGEDASDAARSSLRKALGISVGRRFELELVAVPAAPLLSARAEDDAPFLVSVARGAELVRGIEELYVCEARPPRPPATPAPPRHAMLQTQLDALFGRRSRHGVSTATTGAAWSVRFDRFPCDRNE